ncbi:MAG TPA: CPBP family intramembrane glutamic endopeptidase [Anaeromyxobacteraceae bacterium]|nr:CPBP family intramembrane glutamic endopeptidase [Anaeromyxobacteraceae bacterium]
MSSSRELALPLAGAVHGESRKPTLLLLLAPVLCTAFRYWGSPGFYRAQVQERLVLLGDPAWTACAWAFAAPLLTLALPAMAVAALPPRQRLGELGLGLGDWRFGLKAAAAMAPVMLAAALLAARMPAFRAEYPCWPGAGDSGARFAAHAGLYLVYYVGYEGYFRGLLQGGLRRRLGDLDAVLVQTLATTLVHIGKPAGEIVGAIPAGLAWGAVAIRAGSIWPVVLAHWLLGVATDYFILFG